MDVKSKIADPDKVGIMIYMYHRYEKQWAWNKNLQKSHIFL